MRTERLRRVPWLALAACLAATPGRSADVTVLVSAEVPAWGPAVEAIRAAPGHTVEVVPLHGSAEAGARALGALRSDTLLVAMGPLAAQVASGAPAGVRVVYCMVVDPASFGLGGRPDTTGVAFSVPVRNQLAAFRAVHPAGRRVGVVFSSASEALVEQGRSAASLLGLELVEVAVDSERQVPEAVRALLGGSADALWMVPDPLVVGEASVRFILARALEAGKPVYAFSPALVEQGALAAESPDVRSVGEQVVEQIERIAAGESPGSMAPGVPKAQLTINKRIARRLGIEVPAEMLEQASRVIE